MEELASGHVARGDRWLARRGVVAVLTLRLLPLVPFNLVNYAAGVTALHPRAYVLGTALGIVPGTVAYTLIGARLTSPTDPLFLAGIAGLVVLAVVGAVVAARSERRLQSEAHARSAHAR